MSKQTGFLIAVIFLLISATSGAQAVTKPQRLQYALKDSVSLWVDHYKPVGPANGMSVLFVHGGAFTGGNPEHQYPMAEGLSKRGYRVFIMKYRLYLAGGDFGCGTPTPEKLKAIRWAVEDIGDATGYLLSQATTLGIDKEKLFLSGSSAGAEAILNYLFNPFNRDAPAAADKLRGFRYAGAMAFAGAALDINTVNEKNWVPLLMMHGTRDQLVPFATAAHRYCKASDAGWMMFFGSETIFKAAVQKNLSAQLYTYSGGGHEVSNYMFRCFDDMDAFMQAVANGRPPAAKEIIREAKKAP